MSLVVNLIIEIYNVLTKACSLFDSLKKLCFTYLSKHFELLEFRNNKTKIDNNGSYRIVGSLIAHDR